MNEGEYWGERENESIWQCSQGSNSANCALQLTIEYTERLLRHIRIYPIANDGLKMPKSTVEEFGNLSRIV